MNGWFIIFDDGRHRWELVMQSPPPEYLEHIYGHTRWRRVTMSATCGVAAFYPDPEDVVVR